VSRNTGQGLERRDPQRRYPILLTVVAQSATDVLDEVVQLLACDEDRNRILNGLVIGGRGGVGVRW